MGGKAFEGVGTGLALLGATITVADGFMNGWKPHHIAGLYMDASIYAIATALLFSVGLLEQPIF